VPGVDVRLHRRLARQHGAAVEAHAARAADGHAAGLAVRERAVAPVLHRVEHVEERGLDGHLDGVLLHARRLAVGGAADLDRDIQGE
jgi:hypothetical protein